jgi:membrane associated rhomboid family serine protease
VVTAAILLLCAVVFGWEMVVMTAGGEEALNALVDRWGLVPAELVAAVSTGDLLSLPVADLFTSMFLHGSWLHLMGNMLFLWIFAVNVEDRLGRPLFLAFYLVGGVVAALSHVLVDPHSDVPMVGASGAISAVLGAYLVLYPRARIQSLVFLVFFYELIAVPAVAVLGFWFLLQLIDAFASLGLTAEAGAGIAFWAHVGGFVAGMAMALPIRYWRPQRAPAGALAAMPLPPVPDPPAAPPPPPPPPPPGPRGA